MHGGVKTQLHSSYLLAQDCFMRLWFSSEIFGQLAILNCGKTSAHHKKYNTVFPDMTPCTLAVYYHLLDAPAAFVFRAAWETAGCSEKLVSVYQTTRRHNLQHYSRHIHHQRPPIRSAHLLQCYFCRTAVTTTLFNKERAFWINVSETLTSLSVPSVSFPSISLH